MISFDKEYVKQQITIEQVFELLQEWGGEPEYTSFGILSMTICHNLPDGENSRKLYYYDNEEGGLFHCYTGCAEPSFDIFELAIKVADLQENKHFDLNAAVRALAYRFGIIDYSGEEDQSSLEDWKIFNRYDRIKEIKAKDYSVTLKQYDDVILSRFYYKAKIKPWLREGISQEAIDKAQIGFYPGGDQITIPHFDKDNRLIGVRGRTLCEEEAEYFGKYRPLKINNQLYNHPLGMNVYGLNWAQNNIKTMEKAIVMESEKSVLKYMSFFGMENSIAVACCGSNISAYQIHMLIAAGAKEIVVAFDRDWEKIGDATHLRQIASFRKLNDKYKNYVGLSFINDSKKLTVQKDAPIDKGPEIFLELFKNRVFL